MNAINYFSSFKIFASSGRAIVTVINVKFQPMQADIYHGQIASIIGRIVTDSQRSDLMDKGRRRDGTDVELMMLLARYQQEGVPIYFEDRPSTPQEVVDMMMVREDEVYMPDYVTDKQNKVIQIRYNHVK